MIPSLMAATFLLATAAALLFTPLVRRVAVQLDFVDHPDAHRKVHRKSTAMGGGIAVMAATAVAVGAAIILSSDIRSVFSSRSREFSAIAVAVCLLAFVGLADDLYRLRARYKLLGQLVAATVVAISGLSFERLSFAGFSTGLGWLAVPLTVAWLVTCINAVNLIDGSDGLASVVGIVLAGTIACTSWTLNNPASALVALGLAGALIGFLRYNAPPASIFLGDTGSMTIGLLAGALSIQSHTKSAAGYALLAPLAMWIIPMMDVGMAIVRRKLTGRGISTTDRSHLHHCLLERGFTSWQLLGFVGGLCAFCGLGGWLSVRYSNSWFAIMSSAAVVGYLVCKRYFGHAEFQLARHHFAHLGRQVWRWGGDDRRLPWQIQVRIQGVRPWEDLWAFLVEAAEELQVRQLTLDLNLPWLHEGYHASWARPAAGHNEIAPRLTWPLISGDRNIGTLTIVGASAQEHLMWLEKLLEFLSELQDRLPHAEAAPESFSTAESSDDFVAVRKK